MPGQNYSEIAATLKAAGLAGETPCAIVSRATTPQQRTHRSTIAELHRSPQLPAPTLLVVGEVVRFADPVALADRAGVSSLSNDGIPLPSSLLAGSTFASDFTNSEEPLA